MQSIELYFQWPWIPLNPDFKGKPLFEVEYLSNGTDRDVDTMEY